MMMRFAARDWHKLTMGVVVIALVACGQSAIGGPPLSSPLPADSWRASVTLDGRYTPMRFTTRAADPAVVTRPNVAPEDAKLPVLVFCHGHGQTEEQLLERTSLPRLAAQEGWLAASARLTGKAHWANDEALEALDALIADCVERFGADPRRIYLMGFSMGGGAALLGAARRSAAYPPAAVASSAGFTDLLAMARAEANGGAFAPSIAEAYGGRLPGASVAAQHSAAAQAAGLVGLPIYLEHGDDDTMVPLGHYERMRAALARVGVIPAGRVLPGVPHGEAGIDGPGIVAFFRDKRRE